MLFPVMAVGVALIALAVSAARVGSAYAEPLLWAGLLTLTVPPSIRLAGKGASGGERLALVVWLGIGLYVVKLLQSPLDLRYFDELLHWRTATDILNLRRIFVENPMLPVSAFYPGLELSAIALVETTGLDLFSSAVIIILAARIVLVVAFYLFCLEVTHSDRFAGLATLIYMTNASFIIFSGQFAYESLALPLAVFTVYTAARLANHPQYGPIGPAIAGILGLSTVVVTHHLTSFALVAFLALWVVARQVTRLWNGARFAQYGLLLFGIVATASWMLLVATPVIGYLSTPTNDSLRELLLLLLGESGARPLFTGAEGTRPPIWETALGYGSVLLYLSLLPLGLLVLWRGYRRHAIAVALGVGALLFPTSILLRFTQAGAESSARAVEFVFLALSVPLALSLATALDWLARRLKRWIPPMLSIGLASALVFAVLFMGSVIIGWGPAWARLPGPFLVSADARSVGRQGIAASQWASEHLGSGNRVGADRINALLMGSIGRQRIINGLADHYSTALLFDDAVFDGNELFGIRNHRYEFLVVDYRLAEALPKLGYYFEPGELNNRRYTKPIDRNILAKFDPLAIVSRIYDSGDIVIYDLRLLRRELEEAQ